MWSALAKLFTSARTEPPEAMRRDSPRAEAAPAPSLPPVLPWPSLYGTRRQSKPPKRLSDVPAPSPQQRKPLLHRPFLAKPPKSKSTITKSFSTPNLVTSKPSPARSSTHSVGDIVEVFQFVCEGHGDCKSGFRRAEHLARHIRGAHTGEKPFQCHCGRTFTRLDNLRAHAVSQHPADLAKTNVMLEQQRQVHLDLMAAQKDVLVPKRKARKYVLQEGSVKGSSVRAGSDDEPPRAKRRKSAPVPVASSYGDSEEDVEDRVPKRRRKP